MGLEVPLALLGLLAIGLPWLAHRTKQRDLESWPFPTLALLQRAEVQKRRRSNWTDLWLLLVRMALVAIACIAVADPFVNARLAFGDGKVSSAAIVLDDSMSMLRTDGASDLLSMARQRAREVIRSLPDGSEVCLIAAGAPARLLLPLTDDRTSALAVLDDAGPAPLRATDMDGALALASQQLGAGQHSQRRLLLLSDFASHAQPDAAALAMDSVAIQAERMGGPPTLGNLSFDGVSASPDPTLPGQMSMVVEVRNHGPAIDEASVRITSGGRELAQLQIPLLDGAGRAIAHIPAAAEGDDPTAMVEIVTVDALRQDNRIGVLRTAADGVRVMLVNGDPRPASAEDELYYLRRALTQASAQGVRMSLREVDASALDLHEPGVHDVVVLANVTTPKAHWAEQALGFVKAGGGLLVAPGDNFDPRQTRISLGELLAAKVRSVSRDGTTGMEPEPTASVLPPGPSGLTQVQTRQRLILEEPGASVLRFTDGASALATREIGRGRVALLAVSLDADWSDLPTRPGYLALVSGLIHYLGQVSVGDGQARSGDTHRIELPTDTEQLEIVDPEGRRVSESAPGPSYEYTGALAAGPYRVLLRSRGAGLRDAPRKAFLVHAPGADSDLTPGPLPAVEGAAADTGSARIQIRRSLSPVFFSLAGLLVLCEALLRSRGLRRRSA